MGRHSRPEDLDEDEAQSGVALDESPSHGKHADHAGEPAGAASEAVAEATPEAGRPRPQPPRGALHGTAADVRLIRQRSDVRNRCIAAVLVPFLVYTVALFAVDRASIFLIWIFAPTIAAGVLVGVILDHAHKRFPDV